MYGKIKGETLYIFYDMGSGDFLSLYPSTAYAAKQSSKNWKVLSEGRLRAPSICGLCHSISSVSKSIGKSFHPKGRICVLSCGRCGGAVAQLKVVSTGKYEYWGLK